MIKHLFMNGCSHTALGCGVRDNRDTWTFLLSEQYPLLYNNYLKNLVSENGQVNGAVAGSSNKKIWRTTIDWILKNEDKLKETLFIIQWTYVYRTENYIESNKEDNWERCYFSHTDEWEYVSDESWKCILTLQSLFKNMGLKYVMFEGEIDGNAPDGYKSLSWDSRYVKYIDMKYFFKDGIMNTAGDRKTKCGHANEEANKEWSEKLYNFLQGVRYE